MAVNTAEDGYALAVANMPQTDGEVLAGGRNDHRVARTGAQLVDGVAMALKVLQSA